jgi:prevent-host-death family protein
MACPKRSFGNAVPKREFGNQRGVRGLVRGLGVVVMRTVNSSAAKTHLLQLLESVSRGEKILITHGGKPAAMLVPPPEAEAKDVKKVIEEFKAYSKRQGRTLDGLSIRDLIEEGRRY